MGHKVIRLAHGSGGALSRRLIEETLRHYFDSPLLEPLPDGATLEVLGGEIVFTTDTYVVEPIFFPGGDIGKLAVCGTVNDLVVCGALPRFLSCSLVLEEGFPEGDLHKVLASMQDTAEAAGVDVVTGDTKVVPRGKADGIFINTAGVGVIPRDGVLPGGEIRTGDVVMVSGPIGEHGAAVLSRREGLNLQANVRSDCAPLTGVARAVLDNAERVPFLRDITRGGLATVLNEATREGGPGIVLQEDAVPVRPEVRSVCELLGIEALYLACEGRLAAVLDPGSAEGVLEAARRATGGEGCAVVGRVCPDYPGRLVAETPFGTHRLVQMLSGQQLPRIC